MPETAKIENFDEARIHRDGADVGHNSQRAEVSQGTFLAFVYRQNQIDEKLAALRKERKKIRRRAKDNGIALAEMDAVLKLQQLDDEAVEKHFHDRIAYARFLRLPIGSQLGFFDEPEVTGAGPDTVEKAALDGYAAGLAGQDQSSNPHELNTDAGQAWQREWLNGQKVLADQLRETVDA